ncbi:charged multivesicular body protein 6 [Stylonychia lemnae]|uniref:Charged multivesicular body protein 6 n=1 Tax=Stylonychia lemnae TaxID=5949 RepID=A0A078AAV5_STYLE|nr:charged multivesicular body protein 6 [Stylonychia lemnae]|eukprot:CDW79385.1 charged multivesicular body protein 6 [Stylonychia lemnae]
MGIIFGKSKKSIKKQEETKVQHINNNNHYGGPQKNRVNETDKAILDIKARMKKLKVYTDKIKIQVDQQKEKIQEHLREKNKQRALIALKHKKFLDQQYDKSLGAQTLLQQTLQNIESASIDVVVYDALKQGDQVLSELQSKASIQDFEEIYEKHQDHLAIKEKERELFGQVLNDDDLQDELDQLDAIILEEELPNAGQNELAYNKQSQREEVQEQQVSREAKKNAEKQQPMLA